MSVLNRLYLQAMTTVTDATTGSSVSVSGITSVSEAASGDNYLVSNATLVVHVAAIDAGCTARIEIQDSTDNFNTDLTSVFVQHVVGQVGGLPYQSTCAGASASAGGGPQNNLDRVFRIPWYDIADARFGTASSKMRVNVTSINQALGGTLTNGLTYEVWIEY